ncbi:MAG: hypothetical protein WBF90_00070 [Rivularia sp. (in: cyanobacteria)]
MLKPSLVKADILPPEEEYIESLKNNKTLILLAPILGISLITGVVYWRKSTNMKKDK